MLLALFPFFVLLAFMSYVFRATLHLGHLPRYNNPDPKQLGWWIQHGLLRLSLISFPIATAAAVVLALIGRVRCRGFPVWTIIATALISCATVVAFMRLDPGGLVDWFWD